MRDPFPLAPPAQLVSYLKPLAVDRLGLTTLPLHVHEVLFSFCLYTWIYLWLSPRVSAKLCPRTYPALNARTRLNWDVHLVSLAQSVIITALSIYIIFFDPERHGSTWAERIWHYNGLIGFCQALAGGYFFWDLIVTGLHLDIFGVGMLWHALAALFVFAFGFRPMFNHYGPIFLIYEFSSPFLNIHWFLDKVGLTGSTYQWVNGIVLIVVFFLCRLVWGTWHTGQLAYDVWQGYMHGLVTTTSTLRGDPGVKFAYYAAGVVKGYPPPTKLLDPIIERDALPLWLAVSFVMSNVSLIALNVYWIGKMVETVRNRFPPPFGTKKAGSSAHGKDKKVR